MRNAVILCIDQQCYAAHFLRGTQAAPAGRQKKLTTQPLALHGLIYSQSAKAENRHVIPRQSSCDNGRDTGKFDRGGTKGIEPKNY